MKKLLIVVDYQKDFVNGSLGFKEAEDLDEYLASLIDQYHQNKAAQKKEICRWKTWEKYIGAWYAIRKQD